MNKTDFFWKLSGRLSGLPAEEIEKRLEFFEEMINDYMEDGMTEEEAIAKLGNPEEIANQIIADIPLGTLVKEKIKRHKRMSVGQIVLLAVGSPIWASLLISVLCVVFSILASLWAAFVSFAACGFAGVIMSVVFMLLGNIPSGIVILGGGLAFIGLAILFFFLCNLATKGTIRLIKKALLRGNDDE